MKKIGLFLLVLFLLIGVVACSDDGEDEKTITISIAENAAVGEAVFLDKSASFEPFYQDYIKYEIVGENKPKVKFEHKLNDQRQRWFDTYVKATVPGTVSIKLSYVEGGKVIAESNTVTITFHAEKIGTVEELKGLAGKSGAYQLAADLDLGGTTWSPIAFEGYLDGAGHTISNFKLSDNTDNLGFFSTLKGEVTNVNFENVTLTAMSNKSYVGIVAGLNEGVIDTVTVSGTVSAKYASRVGGIAGKNAVGGVIANSKNLATVEAGEWAGGIVGETHGTLRACTNEGAVVGKSRVGGIAGEVFGTVSHVLNSAAIAADGDYLGGLLGKGAATAKLENSQNTGDVEGKGDYVGGVVGYSEGNSSGDNNSGNVTGRYYVGGFFGYTSGDLTAYKNTATVTGRAYVGGIVGKAGGKLLGCENEGEIIATGTVTEDGKPRSYLGGLAGYCWGVEDGKNTIDLVGTGNCVGGLAGRCEGPVKGSVNDGNITGASAVGGLVGRLSGALMNTINNGTVTSNDSQVGGLAGMMSGTKIEICKNTGAIVGKNKAGGLVGDMTAGCEIIAVENLADVSGSEYVGGYVGCISGKASITGAVNNHSVSGKAYVGGIVGRALETKLVDCLNYGTVLASGFVLDGSKAYTYIGGLAGQCGAISGSKSTVDITAIGDYVGGLAGWATGNISNSECTGNVSGKNYVGGLAGRTDASIIEGVSNGDVTGENYVAGLAGFINGSKVEYSKNLGNVAGNQYVGGIVGFSNFALEVTSAENSGEVRGNTDVGTLVGRSASRITIRNSANYGGETGYHRLVGAYSTGYRPAHLPYIHTAGRLDITQTDEITPGMLGITAVDEITGDELTVTLRIHSGAQVAGSEMVIAATVVDSYGNTDQRYYTVKVYGTPTP